ncbi:hypothetical protein EMIHUDRAFT_435787, partial [Emiliania huxleyi CCMP1516]|uniref:Uncharacterized protein n=2 Tax=Emiliania huxleyi TaxID=2903 RepID=A0A0D3JBX1_EMIH1
MPPPAVLALLGTATDGVAPPPSASSARPTGEGLFAWLARQASVLGARLEQGIAEATLEAAEPHCKPRGAEPHAPGRRRSRVSLTGARAGADDGWRRRGAAVAGEGVRASARQQPRRRVGAEVRRDTPRYDRAARGRGGAAVGGGSRPRLPSARYRGRGAGARLAARRWRAALLAPPHGLVPMVRVRRLARARSAPRPQGAALMTACAGWLAPGGRWSRLREAKQSPCISCLCEFLSFPHFAASRSYNDRVHSLVGRRVLK